MRRALIGLWLACCPAAAASAPATISSSATAGAVEMTSNARGDVALAWTGRRGIEVALISRGGVRRLGAIPGTRSARPPAQLRLALDRRGRLLVGWLQFDLVYLGDGQYLDDCCYRMRIAVRRPGGRLGQARTLTRRPAGTEYNSRTPQVWLGAGGRAMAAWAESCAIVAVRLGTDGSPGRRSTLGECAYGEPLAIAGPNAIIALESSNSETVLTRLVVAGALLRRTGPRVPLGATQGVDAASDARGRATVLSLPGVAFTLGPTMTVGPVRRMLAPDAVDLMGAVAVEPGGWGVTAAVGRRPESPPDPKRWTLRVAVRQPSALERSRVVSEYARGVALAVASRRGDSAVAWLGGPLRAHRPTTVRLTSLGRDGGSRTRSWRASRLDFACLDVIELCDPLAVAVTADGTRHLAWRDGSLMRHVSVAG